MTFLILYSELAEYTLACIRELAAQRSGDRIVVVHYPINKEAPFQFDFSVAEFHSINEFKTKEELESFALSLNPSVIVCSGWMNRWYTGVCRKMKNKSVNVLTLDNHWLGTARQWAMLLISRLTLKHWYKYAWVPGSHQYAYARKLGFGEGRVLRNFYCCDTDRFLELGEKYRAGKEKNMPRVLLCVARYIPAKGYRQLWSAFIRWQARQPERWELWCAGTGDEFDQREQHPQIRHLGFVQKDEWEPIIAQTGIFVLFSHFEPWGVVVHEFAAAGYPLLISNKVGAAEKFAGKDNGWVVDVNDEESVDKAFDAISNLTQEKYNEMAQASRRAAAGLRPMDWVRTLETVL